MKNLSIFALSVIMAGMAMGQAITSNSGVNVIGALPAGSNVIGHVITDTGSVVAISAGSAVIGHVISDSGSVVQLATGSNVIGALSSNQTVNISQINGVTPLMGAGNTGTGSLRVTVATDQATLPVSLNNSTCTGTQRTIAWAAVPTSATSVTATTACLTAITFDNTNGSTQTVTVTDGQGSPVTIISTFVVPANSMITFPFYGEKSTTGFKWTAGGAGITGSATWVE